MSHVQGEYRVIPLDRIEENPDALRTVNRSSEAYLGLVESIRSKGVLKPINVREITAKDGKPGYGLIDGAHRRTAAQDAGLTEIGAMVLNMDDAEALDAQIMANVHKVETRPAEYSQALVRILGSNPTMTIPELAARLAKSPKWLGDRLSITKLHPDIQKLVDEGKINLSNVYALAKLKDHTEQMNYLDRAMTEQPQVFVPLITDRVREINKAKLSGRDAAAEQYVPVAHLRRLKEIEEEMKSGRVAETMKGAGLITNPADFLTALNWAVHMDAESVEEGKRTWEQRNQEKAAKAKQRKLDKAKQDREEADKILAELGTES